MIDRQTRDICVEDVQNLRRMHAQQFRRLLDAQDRGDGPAAGQALSDLVHAHRACADMHDALEYVLTHWTPPAGSTQEGTSDGE